MSHKADDAFFDEKRPWSEKKDFILSNYLEPYLAKVATLNRPILLVDGFAGPGKFRDGKLGSPLIMCNKCKAAVDHGVNVSLFCIEADKELAVQLSKNLSPFSFAVAKHGVFSNFLNEIGKMARNHTTFLYVDPYAIKGLDWNGLDSVFQKVKQDQSSVEILMNFNSVSFVRRGLAALKQSVPAPDPAIEDSEEIDLPDTQPPSIAELNVAVGGEWWQILLKSSKTFPNKVELIAKGICDRLRDRFQHVGMVEIKAKKSHQIPKYHMIFGSRHIVALVLMNDAMVKARGFSVFDIDMFSPFELQAELLKLAENPIQRKALIEQIIKDAFCMYLWKDIRGHIESLLRSGELVSETGKTKINDSVRVWRKPK